MSNNEISPQLNKLLERIKSSNIKSDYAEKRMKRQNQYRLQQLSLKNRKIKGSLQREITKNNIKGSKMVISKSCNKYDTDMSEGEKMNNKQPQFNLRKGTRLFTQQNNTTGYLRRPLSNLNNQNKLKLTLTRQNQSHNTIVNNNNNMMMTHNNNMKMTHNSNTMYANSNSIMKNTMQVNQLIGRKQLSTTNNNKKQQQYQQSQQSQQGQQQLKNKGERAFSNAKLVNEIFHYVKQRTNQQSQPIHEFTQIIFKLVCYYFVSFINSNSLRLQLQYQGMVAFVQRQLGESYSLLRGVKNNTSNYSHKQNNNINTNSNSSRSSSSSSRSSLSSTSNNSANNDSKITKKQKQKGQHKNSNNKSKQQACKIVRRRQRVSSFFQSIQQPQLINKNINRQINNNSNTQQINKDINSKNYNNLAVRRVSFTYGLSQNNNNNNNRKSIINFKPIMEEKHTELIKQDHTQLNQNNNKSKHLNKDKAKQIRESKLISNNLTNSKRKSLFFPNFNHNLNSINNQNNLNSIHQASNNIYPSSSSIQESSKQFQFTKHSLNNKQNSINLSKNNLNTSKKLLLQNTSNQLNATIKQLTQKIKQLSLIQTNLQQKIQQKDNQLITIQNKLIQLNKQKQQLQIRKLQTESFIKSQQCSQMIQTVINKKQQITHNLTQLIEAHAWYGSNLSQASHIQHIITTKQSSLQKVNLITRRFRACKQIEEVQPLIGDMRQAFLVTVQKYAQIIDQLQQKLSQAQQSRSTVLKSLQDWQIERKVKQRIFNGSVVDYYAVERRITNYVKKVSQQITTMQHFLYLIQQKKKSSSIKSNYIQSANHNYAETKNNNIQTINKQQENSTTMNKQNCPTINRQNSTTNIERQMFGYLQKMLIDNQSIISQLQKQKKFAMILQKIV